MMECKGPLGKRCAAAAAAAAAPPPQLPRCHAATAVSAQAARTLPVTGIEFIIA